MTKNDVAWQKLFDKFNIVNEVNRNGFFVIRASDIKEFREPRLMCKVDHENNLSKPFKEWGFAILPISRYEYIIGKYNVFQKVEYKKIKPTRVKIPNFVETIDIKNLYSEQVAINTALLSGMLHRLLNLEKNSPLVQTISGRKGSDLFNFAVQTTLGEKHINVEKAQIEIDGSFESLKEFLFIEAKNETCKDFNIRQLYYPFRVCKNLTKKPIIPTFLTVSNDIFSFFVHEFTDVRDFNSINLVEQKNFLLSEDTITMKEVLKLCCETKVEQEPKNIPFPQANDFNKVVDLITLLKVRNLSKEEIITNYNFDKRQVDYYINIGRYLNYITKEIGSEGIEYTLTHKGKRICQMNFKEKYLTIMKSVFTHSPFKRTFLEWYPNYSLPLERVVEIMKEENLNIGSDSTFFRRASTVIAWCKWMKEITDL